MLDLEGNKKLNTRIISANQTQTQCYPPNKFYVYFSVSMVSIMNGFELVFNDLLCIVGKKYTIFSLVSLFFNFRFRPPFFEFSTNF